MPASIISTTGYTSTDYGLWGPLAETLFFCAMMICGCSGSTAGGPKVFRYQLLVQSVTGGCPVAWVSLLIWSPSLIPR